MKTGPGPIIRTRNDWDGDREQSSGSEMTGPGPGPETFSYHGVAEISTKQTIFADVRQVHVMPCQDDLTLCNLK